ncbi:MAG: glycerophosphodiester phosphodiesterase family protein [candidate division WOR-3 bacterium]
MNLKQLYILILLFISISVQETSVEATEFFQPIKPPRAIQVIAHRGLRKSAPENTIPAFELCIKNYYEWIEVDVRLTKDRQHVIIHDESLNRTTDGEGLVSEHTLDQIKSLDAGAWFAKRFAGVRVPTLLETLNFCKGKINLYLDCKSIDPILLVREIKETEMENQVVVYGDPDTLKIIEIESNGTIATMQNFRSNPDISAWIGDHKPVALEIKYENVNPEIVTKLKNAGVIVQVQCLGQYDNPQTWDKLINMGIDWIQTDYCENVIAMYTWKLAGKNRPVLITAHRGTKSLAPENTIASYKKAIELGLDFIEIDVHQTKDEKLVSIHDSSLKRTTGLDKNVQDAYYDEIRDLSAGAWFGTIYKDEKIPSIDEVFELARGKIKIYVDFKEGEPEYLVDCMRRHGVLESCVIYGDPQKLSKIKLLEPNSKVMPGLNNPTQIDDLIKICQPYAFDTKWEILSKELISECHFKGVKVFSDAMGGHENINDFYKAMEWGIDCIQTDEPIILLRAMEIFLIDNPTK